MKFGFDNSYVFLNGNKHGLITNLSTDAFTSEDFTILANISPDYDKMDELLKDNNWVHQMIVGKNGKHIGLCFTGFVDDSKNIHYHLSFEWWQNPSKEENKNPDQDEVQSIQIKLERDEKNIPVKLVKFNNKFELNVNDSVKTKQYTNIIDYSTSFLWLGCANRIHKTLEETKEFGSIYYGSINKIHIQEGLLLTKDVELFYSDFETFCHFFGTNNGVKAYFSSDFSQISLYKIKDHSNNGNHALLFSSEWLDL